MIRSYRQLQLANVVVCTICRLDLMFIRLVLGSERASRLGKWDSGIPTRYSTSVLVDIDHAWWIIDYAQHAGLIIGSWIRVC